MKAQHVTDGGLAASGRTNEPEADAFLLLLWRDVRDLCATAHDNPLEWLAFAHHVYVQTGHRIWTLAALFHGVGGTPERRRAAIVNLLLPPFYPTVIQEVFWICEALDQGTGPLVGLRPPTNYQDIIAQRTEQIYVFREPGKTKA